jgi:hypothetical protein
MGGHHGHHHGHTHATTCGGLDHHGDYTPQQRADLDLVLGFNRRIAEAIDAGRDPTETERFLDPDPLRYMWVDEGRGQIPRVIAEAATVLAGAPVLPGHERRATRVVEGSHRASRPAVATGAEGTRLEVWLEWVPREGDLLRARLTRVATGDGVPETLTREVRDLFRPTALVAGDGTPWVFYGASVEGRVGVWASRHDGRAWTPPEPVSDADSPAFNQEVVAHADGSVEVAWQGRHKERFGVYSRVLRGGTWSPSTLVTAGVEANVWDPTLAAFADGGTAYAWSEYRDGAYRVVVRRRDAAGRLSPPADLTGGTDYALHPHLAVTGDQQLWCAFDVVTVSGHGGSGPTRLKPAERLADADSEDPVGMRGPGASVPSELLPEVTAGIRVVSVAADGVRVPPGDLGARLDVVPSGMPRLQATEDGGLVVAYRVHRRLPLMTYYWEVAAQSLGPDGWGPASTYRGTDGTLEEVGLAATPTGAVVAAQTDGRLERALSWTEGFGGRECPYLLEHHGSVVWHGIHGLGAVVVGDIPSAGPVPDAARMAAVVPARPYLREQRRREARRWAGGRQGERYVARVGKSDFTLFWGDLHRHSLVSRCTAGDEPSLEDFYRYAWDVCEYDFWAVTDHSENSSDYQWWSIQKIADLLHVPDRFVPLYGFEWTSADCGHQNVIFGDVSRGAPIFSAFASGTTDPDGLWRALDRYPDFPAVTIPHHPGSAMVHHDWDYDDPRHLRLVEVFQACRGSYESDGCFRQYADATRRGTFVLDGLRRGRRFGLIASSDHGHGAAYVGAFARSLDRAEVFDALHERRTFAATTRDIVVDFRAGDVFMGEEAPPGAPRTFTVHARGYTEIARVDILRNGEVAHALVPDLGLPDGWVAVPLRVEWGGADDTVVWDGALRVTGGRVLRTPWWSPDVLAVSDEAVSWRSTTRSFGDPYGAQRGGVELTVTGPPGATVEVMSGGRHAGATLAELARTPHLDVPGGPGHLRLQPGVGGLVGLGAGTVGLTWTDDRDDDAFYYARVFQVDGETAWSSPIWMGSHPER